MNLKGGGPDWRYNATTNKNELYDENGVKIAEIDENGNLRIKGEVSVLQSF